MSRGPQSFKQGDVAKALKAAVSADMKVERYEVDLVNRKIVVYPAKPGEEPTNEWDSVQ